MHDIIILSVQTHIIMTDVLYLHEKPLLSFTGYVTGKVRDNVVVEQGRSLLVLGFGPEYEDMSITHKSGYIES